MIILRIFAQLHSVRMLQAAACVHYVAGLANRYTKVVHMLQAAACVHYVAGFTNRYRKVVRMLQAAACVHYVAGQRI